MKMNMKSKKIVKTHQFERGQALIVVALAVIGILGMVGLAVDGGNVFNDRRKAQNAADSAALASAYTRIKGGDWVGAALEAAANNGYNNDGVNNVVVLYSPPSDGPHKGDIEYLQIIITSHIKTYFARFIGRPQMTNTVEATARTKSAQIGPLLHGLAVVSLAPVSNCSTQRAFWIHGEVTLDITGGGIFVNSNNPTCALVEQGSGSLRIAEGHNIDVVGGASIQKTRLISPAVSVGVSAISYPPPFFMPDVKCNGSAEVSEDGTTMTPGEWGDAFPPPGVTTLESGVYCLGNGMHITSSIEGHNVIFRVNRGDVRFSNGADILLDGPNAGPNKGLLLYMPIENKSKIVLNGGPGSIIKGTVLAPGAHILIKGMASRRGFHSQIIGYTIEADGADNVVIVYNPEQNLETLSMPEVQLAE
jgi:hypothetical protein